MRFGRGRRTRTGSVGRRGGPNCITKIREGGGGVAGYLPRDGRDTAKVATNGRRIGKRETRFERPSLEQIGQIR